MLNTAAKICFGVALGATAITVVMAVVLFHLLFFGIVAGDTLVPNYFYYPPMLALWAFMLAGLFKGLEAVIDFIRYH